MNSEQVGYLYTLTDPRSGEVKYVGATKEPEKRFESHINRPHSEALREWIVELREADEEPEMDIVSECSTDELSEKESELIAQFGFSNNLLNGKSTSGYSHGPSEPVSTTARSGPKPDSSSQNDSSQEDIEAIKARRDELFEIGWEKEFEIMRLERGIDELRNAVDDAREAHEELNGDDLAEALDLLAELVEELDGDP